MREQRRERGREGERERGREGEREVKDIPDGGRLGVRSSCDHARSSMTIFYKNELKRNNLMFVLDVFVCFFLLFFVLIFGSFDLI